MSQKTVLETFNVKLRNDAPPSDWSLALQALWYLGKGNWHRAHELAQQQCDSDGAWVHAHLHRVEGDMANASYWYRRSGREASARPAGEEFTTIATRLLTQRQKL